MDEMNTPIPPFLVVKAYNRLKAMGLLNKEDDALFKHAINCIENNLTNCITREQNIDLKELVDFTLCFDKASAKKIPFTYKNNKRINLD